jgi:hypothetical protein
MINRKVKNIPQIIDEWLENKISKAEFEFSCGGDSMNDTQIYLYDKEGKTVKNNNIEYFIDDEIYGRIRFYEASDGHYLGEFGKVIIVLNENKTDFIFEKISSQEFNEEKSVTILIDLTDLEKSFLSENIKLIIGTSETVIENSLTNLIWKKDKILTKNDEDIINSIFNKFINKLNNFPIYLENNESLDGLVRGEGELSDNELEIKLEYNIHKIIKESF